MSGHSKWSTIKHKKAIEDQRRGKIFTKLGRAISLATREGGEDMETNFKLRLAVDKAKAENMPKENIKRAIERGAGSGDEGELVEISYEGYGPGKVAVIVEIVTDNKNRTASEIKACFDKNGGSIGKPGSVSFLFNRVGIMEIEKQKDLEEQMLKLMDMDVKEVLEKRGKVEVVVNPGSLAVYKEKIEKSGFKILKAELSYLPKINIQLAESECGKVSQFLSGLEEMDEVQNIYTNLE